jgi:hypothetical protein
MCDLAGVRQTAGTRDGRRLKGLPIRYSATFINL